MKNKDEEKHKDRNLEKSSNWQGIDKAPGEEKDKQEKLTMKDLKGKKVDGDPELESDQPTEQKPDRE